MKKKSSVIAKLIIPVAVLGCIAIMIAGVSLYSMTAVQKEGKQSDLRRGCTCDNLYG